MQVITMPVPAQEGITRDNVTVKVDAVVYFKVFDPVRVVVGVQSYQAAIAQVAQASLRSIIGKSELDDLLSNRERLNQGLELMLDSPAVDWGIHIDRVDIKDVALPESMKRSMSRQAEAERERRSRVITAEGELQASEKLAQAAEVMAAHPAALQLRLLQTVVEVAAEKNSTLVLPFPVELLRFLERATPPDGDGDGVPEVPDPRVPHRDDRARRADGDQRAVSLSSRGMLRIGTGRCRGGRTGRAPARAARRRPRRAVGAGVAAPVRRTRRRGRGRPAARHPVGDGVERGADDGQARKRSSCSSLSKASSRTTPHGVRCHSQYGGAVGDRGLDERVVVRPPPSRRRDLAVDDLDGQPLGHDVTLGRSPSAVHLPRLAVAGADDETGPVSDQQPVQLRVGLAQVDTRVGDLAGQRRAGAHLDGEGRRGRRPPRRLPRDDPDRLSGRGPRAARVLRPRQRARRSSTWRRHLAEQGLGDVAVVVGYLAHTEGSGPAPVDHPPIDDADRPGDANPRRGAPRNAAALLYGGEVVVRYYKRHLPNYGVFDEARYFVPGNELPVVRLHGIDIALTICEDLWVEGGPCGVAGQAGRRPRRLPQRLALRAGQGRPAAAAGPPPGRRGAGADRLLQPGRRAGRAGLRRRLARRLRRRRAAGPRAAVRRAPADRRPDHRPVGGARAPRRPDRADDGHPARALRRAGAGVRGRGPARSPSR